MNKFTVFSKKVFHMTYQKTNYITELHYKSLKQPGFIKASSYWDHQYKQIYTVSHWNTKDDWESWLTSKSRDDILKDHKKDLESESHEYLNEIHRSYNSNIFLL